MLYNIFEALHPFPNLKDILFSEFLGKWNRSGLSGRRALLARMLETLYPDKHYSDWKTVL